MGALVGGLIVAIALEQVTKQLKRIADALEEKA
jgi:hypothetical protein